MTTYPQQTTAPSFTDPGYQSFLALRLGFGVLPILFGLDKFANVLTSDWTRYLAPSINNLTSMQPSTTMHIVGVIEIIAGLAVLVVPRLGAPLVAVWLAGIIVNLVLIGGYGDIALRDFGLMAAALALTRLAWAYPTTLPARRS